MSNLTKNMAGRGTVDDSVIERRLRPIYDWLDNGNNKKAVQEADKVLRKQPKLHCASVLKALALLRLGKNNECAEIVNYVVLEGTCDDATLQALTICYREMHQPDLICSMYENAVKLDPTNEDIISHLFMAYVRVGNYKRQQQTAMQLYKLKPKNPYYFWAIMSIAMQSHVTKDSASRKVSLQLAERMILKFVSEDKIESEAEVLTYLYILEIQGKYKEALSVMDGPLARRIVQQPQNFMPLKKALYNTQLCQFEAASIIYMNLILTEPDNWQHYVFFTDAILAMWKKYIEAPEGKADPLQEASKFLIDARDKPLSNGDPNRSPLLGLLQLALKLDEEGLQDKIEPVCGNVTDLLYDYIKHTGDKMCCYSDIVNFLSIVQKDRVSSLLERVESLIEKDSNGLPVNIKNIYRHQVWLQLRKALGGQNNLGTDQELEFADSLVLFYERTNAFAADMAATDIRPNDAYLIMAAHCYFSVLGRLMYQLCTLVGEDRQILTKGVTDLMVKLCCLLEHGIDLSKANFQLKLLLIKAYNMIGAISASYNVYEKLDLKQIQMDTMGHTLALQTLDTGHYPLASTVFSTTLKFFMANYKDTSDPLIMSYKYGSLNRIPEFVEFRERLNNSLHFATVTAEQMILELCTKGNSKTELEEVMKQLDIDPVNEKTVWEDLRDNRDILVMNSWEPEQRKLLQTLKEETYADDVLLLRLRSKMLRIMGAAHALRKCATKTNNHHKKEKSAMMNGTACDENASTNVLQELLSNLSAQIESCDKYAKRTPPQIPLQGPDIPRIYLYMKGHHLQCILKHAEMVLKIYNCTEGPDGLDSWSGDVLKSLNEVIDQEIAFILPQLDVLEVSSSRALPGINAQPLGHLSHFLQTVSFVLILLESCNHFLVPLKANVAKKNKKKKGNVALPEIISHYNTYVSSLQTKLQKVETAFNDKGNTVRTVRESEEISFNSESLDSLIPDLDYKSVCKSIQQSFSIVLAILNLLLKSKLKFLSSLKI